MNRTVLGLIAALSLCSAHHASAQILVDRAPLPASVEGMADISSLVIRGRVSSAREVSLAVNAGRAPNQYVEYTVEVLEVIKPDDHVSAPGTMRVLSTGNLRVQERGLRVFQRGEEFVMFLHWRPFLKAHAFTGGPDGLFQVQQGRLAPIGASSASQRQAGGNVQELLERLRAHVSK